MQKNNIAVLGDGGWGTTLAILLAGKGHQVTLWGAFADYSAYLRRKRVNDRFLPSVRIPRSITITHSFNDALDNKEVVILAVPSEHMRQVLKKCKRYSYSRKAVFISVAKGIEVGSLKRMSEVIVEELGKVPFAVLSGPTIAHEVAQSIPTTVVVASANSILRKRCQELFMTERFRVYTNSDVVGVELGGSLKNVIAIACGISDGLGFGTNAKAALLSRGLVEISRLGVAMGANARTFSGLSGLGDLVTTCISPYSRNRFVGEQIGKGKHLKEIKARMQMVAEGIPTTRSAYALALRHKADTPIINEVFAVLYRHKSPLRAVKDLMTRARRGE
ncbi:MAG: NAD(P)-dependent glycerol-3-phosphate dehydrogenase [Candidatus Omnitrophota bacterium]|jgi:glycerol-3-phosphate dehydrogenase (NAD(P)+)|nr:MAG: NAD(P)-dependent glycerol-3-phosphate dehydrogenase [Candidatus Omnitrophota bacterium]